MNDIVYQITRRQVAEAARSLIGVPYIHQGRTIKGLDCVGLIVVSFGELRAGAFDRKDYLPTGTGVEISERLRLAGFLRKSNDERHAIGDVVCFWVGTSARAQHLGIMTALDRFIHVHQGVGKVVEHGLRGAWLRRVASVWELKEWRR